MKTLSRFVAKYTSLIVAVLSCFDRVIFKGHLPISNGPALEGFVDQVGRRGPADVVRRITINCLIFLFAPSSVCPSFSRIGGGDLEHIELSLQGQDISSDLGLACIPRLGTSD